ncbi:transcriptional regulator [Vibrio zhanjiangensis]|uniref:Transcriptional regulator n=1 Tax=Vibrio zhanjiangensis TaxID=1046128 RepID=A0ABQ6F113_9VIBR|nr:LysR family transcriptional regulator [Vibrio zhanjiangensis]GLT19183.1 transcriptional regulator [Vibrio zhanjiangensis]
MPFTSPNMNYLRRVDLNHLVTLQALLSEKHISRAAIRLSKSQPAVSHSLAYLRKTFDDPLLIRRAGKLELTSKAEELLQPLEEALAQLTTLFEPPEFSPKLANRTFRIAMSDYGSKVVLPNLLSQIRVLAPDIKFVVKQGSQESMIASVMDGESDIAFGVFPEIGTELQAETLFEEEFICVADRSTIPECGYLSLSTWLSRFHLLVALKEGIDNEIDNSLSKIGHRRNISLVLPHYGIASELVKGTDLILTVAKRAIDTLEKHPELVTFNPPFHIDSFKFDAVWHRRKATDLGHIWLRKMIYQSLSVNVKVGC